MRGVDGRPPLLDKEEEKRPPKRREKYLTSIEKCQGAVVCFKSRPSSSRVEQGLKKGLETQRGLRTIR
jgi:hypothetical protein